MHKIAAVIVTFNRLDKLKKSLVFTLQEPFDKIIIINNASTDGTSDYLSSIDDERVHSIHLTENIGGAGGFYTGFKYVAEHCDVDWLVCYDDDAYPEKGSIELFKQLKIPRDAASLAAAVYLPSGKISRMNIPRYNPFRSLKLYIDKKAYNSTEDIDIDMSSFVGYFVRTDLMRQYRYYPEKKLFIYGDDLIYSYGLKKRGWRHLFIPRIRFIHDCATLTQGSDVYRPLWKVYFILRNGTELYRSLFYPSGVAYLIVKYIQLITKSTKYNKKEREQYIRLINKAFIDAWNRNFSVRIEDLI